MTVNRSTRIGGAHGADVVIVGAGIAGASLLHALARRGVDALLVERAEAADRCVGASSIPAALLNPYRGRTGRARKLDLDGLAEFWSLADRLSAAGFDTGTYRSGVVRVASTARQATNWRRLADTAVGPRWLEPPDVPAPYRGPHGGLLVPDGGWVEAAKLLAALTGAARTTGARVQHGVELTGWRAHPHGGLLVEVVAGCDRTPGELRARELILCLGAYDAGACRLPRLELAPGVALTFTLEQSQSQSQSQPQPQSHSPSQPPLQSQPQPRSPPQPSPTTPPPLAGAVGIVFRGREALVSGGVLPLVGGQADPGALAEATNRLREAAGWFLPNLLEAPVSATWQGVRARRATGNPVVRRLARGVTLYGGLAGRGFLCAPLLSARLADAVAARLA